MAVSDTNGFCLTLVLADGPLDWCCCSQLPSAVLRCLCESYGGGQAGVKGTVGHIQKVIDSLVVLQQ